jgi:hypothetical protein
MKSVWLALAFSLSAAQGARAARIAVDPGTLCEVSFSASVAKGPVVEDDPALAELLPFSIGRPAKTGAKFAGVAWNFVDSSGRRIRHPHISNDCVTLFSRSPRRFSFRAYAPENAVAVEVAPSVLTEGDSVKIESLTVSPVAPGKILNQNSDFSADDCSLPGWKLSGSARFVCDAAGRRCAMLEDGGVFGDLFPVEAGKTLAVTLKAAPPRYATKKRIPWAAVHFYGSYAEGANKKQPFARPKLTVHSATLSENTETYRIPASAKWCRIVVRAGTAYRCEARMLEGDRE